MRQRPWLLVLTAALLLSLPVLWLGFFNDDIIHRVALSNLSGAYHRDAFSLYDFLRSGPENAALMDTGLLPWFTDPALTVRFFRPLSSLLLSLDFFLFGDRALPAHLHSLAWFLLVVGVVWKIHRALLPERAALVATLVFAVAGAHVETTSWIAARHMLVGGFFGLVAWWTELRREKLGGPKAVALGAASLALGLAASEATLTAVPFVLAQTWFGAEGAKRRMVRVFPLVLLLLAYFTLYVAGSYGTRNIGGYVNPFEAPDRFALAVAGRLPLLANELFTSVPAVLSYAGDGVRQAFWALGCLVAALVVAAALRRRRSLEAEQAKHLGWLPWATAAALVPVCGTILDGRLLVVPMVGSSALIGLVLAPPASAAIASTLARVARVAGVAALVLLHFGLAPLVRVAFALNYRGLSRIEEDLPRRAELRCDPRARLLVVNGSDPAIGMYGAASFYRSEGLGRPGWHVLSMAQNDLLLERAGERALVLSSVGERRAHFIEGFYRPAHHALRTGDVVRLATMTVTVLADSPSGPTRVRFDLDSDPEGPKNCLARWVGGAEGHLESVTLPVQGLRVHYEPGPMGL